MKKPVIVIVGQVYRSQYGVKMTVLRVDELYDTIEYWASCPRWETPRKSGHELSLFKQFVLDRHFVRTERS